MSSTQVPHLWLRAEIKPMEERAALTPATTKVLLDNGFQIAVERSHQRIFDDEEYVKVGCTLVDTLSWKTEAPSDAYIVGLNELPENDDSPLHHIHIFFAHCFKNQDGWKKLLHRFNAGRHVAAFGSMAGFVGSAVAIDVWCHQQTKPNVAYERLAAAVASNDNQYPKVMVMVMGALGRYGASACNFARKAGISEENIIKWDINETKAGGPFPEIMAADIFVNCIYLNQKIPPFITQEVIDGSRKLSIICDVSCETTNPNNPIPVKSSTPPLISPSCVSLHLIPSL